VAILGEAAARQLWPGLDPIGRSLTVALQEQTVVTVVGVARDVVYRGLVGSGVAELFVYLPLQQHYQPQVTVVVRQANAPRLGAEIGRLVTAMNPDLPVLNSRTFDDDIAIGMVPQRAAASIAGASGFIGLLLAGIGIYGVTAYAVARRAREIAVRLALGATRGAVSVMVLKQGAILAVIGSVVGLVLGAAANAGLTAVLFGVSPFDVPTFAAASVLFISIALAASFVPVRRAVRIDATAALRCE
jgi:putative ABC transport system permease protein